MLNYHLTCHMSNTKLLFCFLDSAAFPEGGFDGEMPQMPEGGFGGEMPQWGAGEMPERDFSEMFPGGDFDGERPFRGDGNMSMMQGMRFLFAIKKYWLIILVVAGILEAASIFMWTRCSKNTTVHTETEA